jgi:hypothetical protein
LAFDISALNWLKLSALAFVLYVAILPVWWFSLGIISAAAGTCASWIYALSGSGVSISPDSRTVQVSVTAADGTAKSSGLRMDTVTYGWPMLVALVMVTGKRSLASKARPLLIGSAVMFVFSVLAVVAWASLTRLQMEQQTRPGAGDRSSFLYLAFHGYAFLQPAIAVLIWLSLVMLGRFNIKDSSRSVPTSRNAPCPCGSGRKYKRCCGRR